MDSPWQPAPQQPPEAIRLAALRGYALLDTPPEATFDRVTDLAARHFKVPISTVSLVDEDRIWFKARHGLDARQVPRDPGFCATCILSDQTYVVRDAAADPRSHLNPLVTGDPRFRFYAAAPLTNHEGLRIGTLNIVDFEPRDFDADGASVLQNLAGVIMDQMELRRTAQQAISSLGEWVKQGAPPGELKELLTVCAWTQKIRIEGEWFTFEEFLVKKLGLTLTHGIHPDAIQQFLKET